MQAGRRCGTHVLEFGFKHELKGPLRPPCGKCQIGNINMTATKATAIGELLWEGNVEWEEEVA